jgi:fructosamine-3-kinase
LGRSLAALHNAPFAHWGGGSSWIGGCRIDPSPWPDGAAFYGARLGELSRRWGLENAVASVVDRLGELLPPGGPSLLHGDLWWGNVLFGADGRAWLIDPSVHGGHPEEDLAMLALFGQVPDRLVRAYAEVRPLTYRAQAEAVAQQFR